MAENTKIEWAHHTFNPWIGCTKVGPGCDHCYAEKERASTVLGVKWGANMPRHRTGDENWKKPGRWNKEAEREGVRYRVFCASLADVFDNEVPDSWRIDLLDLIHRTPHLDWLLLTKRIGNAHHMLNTAASNLTGGAPTWWNAEAWPNVWIGATICNPPEAARDIHKLLAVPAARHFLSLEPLLGPVDLTVIDVNGDAEIYPLRGTTDCVDGEGDPADDLPAIDWVIVGGESGPNARPMHPDWARSLRDQCQAAGVPFLFKQWGEWAEFYPDLGEIHSMETSEGKRLAAQCDGFISQAGEFVRYMDEATTDSPYRGLSRIGKKAAGRLLDGRTWDEVPAC